MAFKTIRDFYEFQNFVKNVSRFHLDSIQAEFIENVVSSIQETTLKAGKTLWRAQIAHIEEDDENLEDLTEKHADYYTYYSGRGSAPAPPERMIPDPKYCQEGRANPLGIICLYLADSMKTSIAEVRPWIESNVTVARFSLKNDARLVDCTVQRYPFYTQFYPKDSPQYRNNLHEDNWWSINRAFSRPVSRNNGSLDYCATQYLTSVFQQRGYNGILYKSSLMPDGKNIALFDITSAEPISAEVCQITGIEIKHKYLEPDSVEDFGA